jgi:hypothetical protein
VSSGTFRVDNGKKWRSRLRGSGRQMCSEQQGTCVIPCICRHTSAKWRLAFRQAVALTFSLSTQSASCRDLSALHTLLPAKPARRCCMFRSAHRFAEHTECVMQKLVSLTHPSAHPGLQSLSTTHCWAVLTVSLSTHSASCRDLSASSRMWLLAPRSTMVHASPSATPAAAPAAKAAAQSSCNYGND